MTRAWLIGVAVSAAALAWGADAHLEAPPPVAHAPSAPAARSGSTLELSWDNGTMMYLGAWDHPRAGEWRVGNDFDTSTLEAKVVKILKFKTFTSDRWPNEGWDGFRIAFFDFRGGLPREMLWPTSGQGYFFKPSGVRGHVWVECPINWTCPTPAFVAARDQGYNYPDCDPFSVDTNLEYKGHSWMYVYSFWSGFSETPYKNLMLRVWVDVTYTHLQPTSLGRVKALFY